MEKKVTKNGIDAPDFLKKCLRRLQRYQIKRKLDYTNILKSETDLLDLLSSKSNFYMKISNCKCLSDSEKKFRTPFKKGTSFILPDIVLLHKYKGTNHVLYYIDKSILLEILKVLKDKKSKDFEKFELLFSVLLPSSSYFGDFNGFITHQKQFFED